MNAPILPKIDALPNQVLIMGKVVSFRDWESDDGSSGYVTRLRLPAASEYESAHTVEISSRRKLGKQEDEVKLLCRITGFVKRGKNQEGKAYDLVNMRLVGLDA